MDCLVMLPCPFCGGADIDRSFWATEHGSGPGCSDCGATADTEHDWNSRPDVYPIFDVLPRLWATGHKTKEQDGEWWLFDGGGEGIVSGRDFRGLCVNIILAGI